MIEKTDYIVIHDAARPFLKEEYILKCLKALDTGYEGAVIGVKK